MHPVCEESLYGKRWGRRIKAFNYDWLIFAEYIGIQLAVFTESEEAINHANESELMSANTLVFIRM